ncbi:MAG: hypothetical protein ACTSUE_22575 [Promethearchaeota archaeon]
MIEDSIRKELESKIMSEHKRLYMAVYSFIQHAGSLYDDAGLDLIKKVKNAGEQGLKRDEVPGNAARAVQYLEKGGFIKLAGEIYQYDMDAFISTLASKMALGDDELVVAGDLKTLFSTLIDQMTLDVDLPPIRRDGIGLNRDFIFNRLRGYVRQKESGAFSKTILPWLT